MKKDMLIRTLPPWRRIEEEEYFDRDITSLEENRRRSIGEYKE